MDSDKNDPSDHSCDTSLSLGRLTNTFITKKEKSVLSSLKFDHVLPCLSLGTVSHHQGSASLGSSSYNNNNDDDNDNSGSMKRTTSDQEDDDEEEASPRKKLRLNKDQAVVLEDSFKQHTTLNPIQKDALAKQLNLRPRQVEVWFQNRRARTKMKQTEVECETLKKEWEKLTEDNKRLQEELQHLKSSAGSVYVQIPVSGSLASVCPSCSHHYPSSSRKAAVFPKTADGIKAPQLFTHSPTAC